MFHTKIPHHESALHVLVDHHAEALCNAAGLLAGSAGEKLAHGLWDDLMRSPEVSRKTMQRAEKLLKILGLENVHIDGSEEAGFFAMIDPADPVVEEICCLTDALREALATTTTTSGHGPYSRAAA